MELCVRVCTEMLEQQAYGFHCNAFLCIYSFRFISIECALDKADERKIMLLC